MKEKTSIPSQSSSALSPGSPVGFRSDAFRLFAKSSATLAGAAMISTGVHAQETAPSNPSTVLPTVVVTDEANRYEAAPLTGGRYTQPLVDIPRTVTVIPQEVIQEQGATSLRDVLRNVPGVTMNAGEGGAVPGDNLTIRGFNSRSDVFLDGVRDLGSYNRDPFNYEQVEIFKGPGSANSGRGSTGGSISLATKTPKADPFYGGSATVGDNGFYRMEMDFNQPFYLMQREGEADAAFRLNGMFHETDVAGRDRAHQERWGIAPSLAFGLGSDTRLTLTYMHQDENNIPDYGIPWVPPATTGTIIPELAPYVDQLAPVKFSNFYGTQGVDREDVITDVFGIAFEHDFSDQLKFRNFTRFARTDREHIVTPPRFEDVTLSTDIRRSDIKGRQIQNELFSNTSELRAEFSTGGLEHSLLAGLEFTHEEQITATHVSPATLIRPVTDLYHPNFNDPFTGTFTWGTPTDATSRTFSAYLFDTIKFNKFWEISGGVRFDNMESEFNDGTYYERTDEMVSWRAALTYKPAENGSIYFGVGSSFNPSLDGNILALSTSNIDLDPEKSFSYELGTKWELFEGQLSLNAALFRTEKTEARTSDAVDPTLITLGGEQAVQGVELGFTGNLTDHWTVIGGYTYLDSEVSKSNNVDSAGNREQGNPLANTPEHSFSLWTVFDIAPRLQMGLGAQYVGERNNNNFAVRQIDDFITFEAMLGYQVTENFDLRLNVHNLADEEYIDRAGGGHAIPGAGRSVSISGSLKF